MCLIKEMDDLINNDMEFLGNPDGKTSQFYKIPAQIDIISDYKGIFYEACPECKKKVIPDTFGTWQCEKCNKTMQFSKPTYNFRMRVSDCSGSQMINILGERCGDPIVGMSAEDYKMLVETGTRIEANQERAATSEEAR